MRNIRRFLLGTALAGLIGGAGWLSWAGYRTHALWVRAVAAADRGEWGEVNAALTERTRYFRSSPEVVRLHAKALQSLGRIGELGDLLLQQYPMDDSDAAEVFRAGGELTLQSGYLERAESLLYRSLRLEPKQRKVLLQLMGLAALQDQNNEYQDLAWQLHGLENPLARFEALRYLAHGRPVVTSEIDRVSADLGQFLEMAHRAEPENPRTFAAYIQHLRERGQLNPALSAANDWMRERGEHPEVYAVYLGCLLDAGDVSELQRKIDQESTRLFENIRYLMNRAAWNRLNGNPHQALSEYEKALRLQPNNPTIREQIAQLQTELEETDAAKKTNAFLSDARRLEDLMKLPIDRILTVGTISEAGRLCRNMLRNRESMGWNDLRDKTALLRRAIEEGANGN